MRKLSSLLVALGLLVSGGCAKQPEAEAPTPEKVGKAPAKAGEESTAAKISKVVFLDQKECCDCTRERQAKTWGALQSVIKEMKPTPVVEVVHRDTQPEDAAMFLDLEPVMVSPGLYFFGGDGVLTDTLQGELTAAQILKVME